MPLPVLSKGRRGLLLVCDESSDFHALTREAFAGARLRVDLQHADTGAQCLAMLRGDPTGSQPRPDALLLDLSVQRVDAAAVIQAIREDAALRTLPVVVYASAARPDDVHRMYALGCNTFIRKPATLTALRRDLRLLVRYWFELALLPDH